MCFSCPLPCPPCPLPVLMLAVRCPLCHIDRTCARSFPVLGARHSPVPPSRLPEPEPARILEPEPAQGLLAEIHAAVVEVGEERLHVLCREQAAEPLTKHQMAESPARLRALRDNWLVRARPSPWLVSSFMVSIAILLFGTFSGTLDHPRSPSQANPAAWGGASSIVIITRRMGAAEACYEKSSALSLWLWGDVRPGERLSYLQHFFIG